MASRNKVVVVEKIFGHHKSLVDLFVTSIKITLRCGYFMITSSKMKNHSLYRFMLPNNNYVCIESNELLWGDLCRHRAFNGTKRQTYSHSVKSASTIIPDTLRA